VVGGGQAVDPLTGGGEQDPVPGLTRPVAMPVARWVLPVPDSLEVLVEVDGLGDVDVGVQFVAAQDECYLTRR
jgi:hypothetical protein